MLRPILQGITICLPIGIALTVVANVVEASRPVVLLGLVAFGLFIGEVAARLERHDARRASPSARA